MDDNQASSNGGGLYGVNGSPSLSACTITGNTATLGEGLYVDDQQTVLDDCLVPGNGGDAIYGIRLDALNVSGCTLADNTGAGISGGWLVATVDRTIIAFNTAQAIECAEGPITLQCTDVYGNEGGDWVGCIAGQESGNQNLSEDPMFCGDRNEEDPYTLMGESPLANVVDCGGYIGARDVACWLVDVNTPDVLPAGFQLHPCSPNPFNPVTTLRFEVPATGPVTLHVYDVTGREVRSLLDERLVTAGERRVRWDGRDDGGRPVASGAHFGLLVSGDFRATQRMLLAK